MYSLYLKYMKPVKIVFILLAIAFFGTRFCSAQIAKTQVVQLSAIANSNGTITLKWPSENYTGNFVIYHRDLATNNRQWSGPDATLPGTSNSFTDVSTKLGTDREYFVCKILSKTIESRGYIYAGNSVLSKPNKGHIVLLIDSAYIKALAKEITILQTDLLGSGWFPKVMYAGRNEKPSAIHNRMKSYIDGVIIRPKSLYIIGHVPVPYSGNFSSSGDRPPPDGHVEGAGNHTGAWPADLYYGDFVGDWSDNLVSCETGSQKRNHNIPGDGKFDLSAIENPIELEIGRADLFAMDQFSINDTLLIKEYLNRVHDFKTEKKTYSRRALIDNNFTTLNLASTGYHNFPCFVGLDSVSDDVDYFTGQNTGSYLWSYGCGGGSFTSCNGIGTSNDFMRYKGKFNNAFTILCGSYFGDWDNDNNFLRAPLAAGSLTSCWGGIPKWYFHHMGLGMNIGFGTKITQNNALFDKVSAQDYPDGNFNYSANGVYIALMGDPTLCMLSVSGPSNLLAKSKNGTVTLSWNASKGKIDGYIVYRIDTAKQEYKEISWWCPGKSSRTIDTTFTDLCNWSSGNYLYAVRAHKMETTGSGSYENLSIAAMASVAHTNTVIANEQKDIALFPNPSTSCVSASGLSPNLYCEIIATNMLGERLFTKSLFASQSGSILIDLGNLETQIVQLKIIQGRTLFAGKVLYIQP